MVEPSSIVATVASLTATCLKVSQHLNAICGKFSSIGSTLDLLSVEYSVTTAAISRLQDLLQTKPKLVSAMSKQQQDLTRAFQIVFAGLSATISILQEELANVTSNKTKKASIFTSKAKFVWNDNVLKELLRQLRDQRSSIGFLVDCIQTDSLADIQSRLRSGTLDFRKLQRASRRATNFRNANQKSSASIIDVEATSDQFAKTLKIKDPKSTASAATPIKPEIPRRKESPTESLYDAIRHGDVGKVERLLRHDSSHGETLERSKIHPIHQAVALGNVRIVDALFLHGSNMEHKTPDGDTPLTYALFKGQEAVAECLIRKGANIEARDIDGLTPLQLAAQKDFTRIVKLLLQIQPSIVDSTDEKGWTSLHLAAENGHVDMLAILLGNGASIDVSSKTNETPLHVAASEGHNNCVALLVEQGSRLNAFSEDGWAAIHAAVLGGHHIVVRTLIQAGADIDIRAGLFQHTPLMIAAEKGDLVIFDMLMMHGAAIDATTTKGYTALHHAAQEDNKALVATLLHYGAQVDIKSNKGSTPLHLASTRGHWKVARLLMKYGASPEVLGEHGFTALHFAAQESSIELVEELLSSGARINAQCLEHQRTPLYCAASCGQTQIVELLLSKGADMELCSNERISPLGIAAQEGHIDIVHLLLENGASLTARTTILGTLPIHLAALKGRRRTIELLLSYGGQINSTDNFGNSVLHWAIGGNHKKAAQILISNGAKVDAKNVYGGPIFLWAAQHPAMISFLVDLGANIDDEDNNGTTALHVAACEGHMEGTKALLQKGASRKAFSTGVLMLDLQTNGLKPECPRGTPADVAHQMGHIEIAKLIENFR